MIITHNNKHDNKHNNNNSNNNNANNDNATYAEWAEDTMTGRGFQ